MQLPTGAQSSAQVFANSQSLRPGPELFKIAIDLRAPERPRASAAPPANEQRPSLRASVPAAEKERLPTTAPPPAKTLSEMLAQTRQNAVG